MKDGGTEAVKPWDAGSYESSCRYSPKFVIRQQKMGYNFLWNAWLLSMVLKVCMASGELVAASSTSSSSCGQSMWCAGLTISYPFWDSTACAASPTFVLSNCSSASPYAQWDSLSTTLQAAVPGDPPPTPIITNITVNQFIWPGEQLSTADITLTWDTSLLTMDFCASLFTSQDFSKFHIPSSINLTGFGGDEFQLSSNFFLFFNCTNKTAVSQYVNSTSASGAFWEQEGAHCSSHKRACPSELFTTSCISMVAAFRELIRPLHDMETLACSHFTFGSVAPSSYPYYPLRKGLLRIYWQREYPYDAGTKSSTTLNGTKSSTTLICWGVTLSVVAILMGSLVGFWYSHKIGEGFHALSSSLACLSVNLLKKLLKRLQKPTYRPNLSIILRELDGLTERPIKYSYSSIASATKSFSRVVGEGGFGVVYKGTLAKHGADKKGGVAMEIAVKVLEIRSKHVKKQFLNEVATIGRVHHVNMVRLLGFCVEDDQEMLVYEYVANGSLDRWLFPGKSDGGTTDVEKPMLDWSQRYAIALGVARGLSYLHEECRHRTVHCDIKPQNILLDERMSPKIADFGLSRLMGREESQVVTLAKGTPGYMAPEFWTGGESRLSTKFDVYSYGMVLLELISGGHNFVQVGDSVCCFPAVAFEAAMQGNMEAILDPRLGMIMEQTSDAEDGAQVWNAAFAALWCIQDHPASRPAMSEVVQYLEGTMAISKNPPPPGIAIFRPLTPFAIASHDSEGFTQISTDQSRPSTDDAHANLEEIASLH